jgi:hypothetical protein
MGAIMFGLVVAIVNIKIFIISNDHSIASISVVCGSMIMYILFFYLVSSIVFDSGDLYNYFTEILFTPKVHLLNILVLGCTTMKDLAFE